MQRKNWADVGALKFPVKLFEKNTFSEYNEAIKHEWRLL